MARIIERGLAADGRRIQLDLAVPDRPGGLHRLTEALASLRANILDIRHERAFSHGPFGDVDVEVTLETRGPEHVDEILASLEGAGFAARRRGDG